MVGPRQAAVSKGRICGCELSIAVGRQVNAGEGLVVQGEREGQRDGGDLIVSVITNVGCARHDRTSDLGYSDLAR